MGSERGTVPDAELREEGALLFGDGVAGNNPPTHAEWARAPCQPDLSGAKLRHGNGYAELSHGLVSCC